MMLDNVQEVRNEGNGKWCLFFGWDPELIADLPALSMTFLDENIASDVAIGVIGQSGHVAWANTLAFQESGVSQYRIFYGCCGVWELIFVSQSMMF